jgi:coproporphyrinogen III oxidase-like Fe-S oxidoreductase
MEGKRWWNYSSLKSYIKKIEEEHSAVRSSEQPGTSERLMEYVMLTLRSAGTDLQVVADKFDKDWYPRNRVYLEKLSKNKLLSIDNNYMKLTPAGYAICDEILLNIR